MKNKTHFSDNETKAFKGENLHVQSKSLIRELIQKPFLKFLQKIFPKKFLFYKNKIRTIMNGTGFYLRFSLAIVYLRFKYPLYFRLPSKHLYAVGTAIKFLEILKPKKIDFFLMGGCLLGAIRQESFAGRPSDIDFGIKEHELQKLLDAFPLLMKKGVRTIRENKEDDIIQFLFPCALVDVEVFRKKKMDKNIIWTGKKYQGITFPDADLKHLITIKVYGKKFLSPADPEIYLDKAFGKNWRIPDKKQFFWTKDKFK